jgi:GMP synthase-like glutamine amidotransferase
VKKLKVNVLQHVPFEDIGSMAPWLKARGAEVNYTRFYENHLLPDRKNLDLVIVMGGPMSVNEETKFPWLRPEKHFIHEAVGHGVSVLGVCLGAQLIASALGSRVYRNRVKEIGWFPIEGTPAPSTAFRFPSQCTVFHWHGETFDIPAGAVRLARSEACENQAFQLKENVIGLQFHLETTRQSARTLVEHCSHELVPSPYIQSASQLYDVSDETYAKINGLMDQVLVYIMRFAG